MPTLAQQRCFNHATREAVARCPECKQYYCRECITEHDDRAICATCLRKLARVPLFQRRGFAGGIHFLQCAAGGVLAWFFFYLVGQTLLTLPSSFHEGTLWQSHWFDQQPKTKSKSEIRRIPLQMEAAKSRQRHGLRWQSAAAPPPFGRPSAFEGGGALRFPPHSMTGSDLRISDFGFIAR